MLRRADRAEQIADLELVIKGAAASPEQRFIVVEYDGHVAGSVFLRLTTVSPINLDPASPLDPALGSSTTTAAGELVGH